MYDLVGQQFGSYHIVKLLGKGSFGDVYLGEVLHPQWTTVCYQDAA